MGDYYDGQDFFLAVIPGIPPIPYNPSSDIDRLELGLWGIIMMDRIFSSL
jgi:hypothetical protein